MIVALLLQRDSTQLSRSGERELSPHVAPAVPRVLGGRIRVYYGGSEIRIFRRTPLGAQIVQMPAFIVLLTPSGRLGSRNGASWRVAAAEAQLRLPSQDVDWA